MALELRTKVEQEFQRRMCANEELLPRKDVIALLTRLGLDNDEAVSFLDCCDPQRKPQVSYKGFLDFIYGPVVQHEEARAEESEKAQTVGIEAPVATADGGGEAWEASAIPDCTLDSQQPDLIEKKITGSTILDSTVGQDSCAMSASQTLDGPGFEAFQLDAVGQEPSQLEPVAETAEGSPSGDAQAEIPSEMPPAQDDVLQGEAIPATPEPEYFARMTTPDAAETETTLQAPPAPPDEPPKKPTRCSHCRCKGPLFQDPNDSDWYCEQCWADYYGTSPASDGQALQLPPKLVTVVATRMWTDAQLQQRWATFPIYGWPPYASPTPAVPAAGATFSPGLQTPGEVWKEVKVRVVPDLVGPHAREMSRHDRPYVNEVLAGRYRIETSVGAGHFTRALLATDTTTGKRVCIKRHNGLTVEVLTDLLAIGERLQLVDPKAEFFPRLIEAFYDMSGYTVETLIQGRNCLEISRSNRAHFQKMSNLQAVARGTLAGLALLSRARVVHADVKPDNIMWCEAKGDKGKPAVKLVDFGCARLDKRIENGRNWALNEGGAGHLGKWTPEMVLRLPITDRTDVWGLAVTLLEVYSGRALWCCEADTVEIILAQVLGLTNARDGLPVDLLRRSPLDITKLYSPAPHYFPVRRTGKSADAPLEELRPAQWGLGVVLGDEAKWDEPKRDFAEYVKVSMTLDHEERPSAAQLLGHRFVVEREEPKAEPEEPKVEQQAESNQRNEAICPEERPED